MREFGPAHVVAANWPAARLAAVLAGAAVLLVTGRPGVSFGRSHLLAVNGAGIVVASAVIADLVMLAVLLSGPVGTLTGASLVVLLAICVSLGWLSAAAAVRAAAGEHQQARAAEAESCCGPGGGCGSGPTEVTFGQGLYSTAESTGAPAAAVAASLGCGVPTAVADLRQGEVVLDLGSGAGADVLISARRVAPGGRVYGLDMTTEMLELARRNAAEAGVDNVEFLQGYLEDVPLPAASVDVVISNCVINLAADKAVVLREAARVLRPSGRFAVSDVIADADLDADTRAGMGQWTGCVAGALTRAEFEQALSGAGLVDVEIVETHRVHEFAASAIVRANRLPDLLRCLDRLHVRSGAGEPGGERPDAGIDVVADQPHPLHAVDAAFGRLVGVPVLDAHAVGRVHGGFPAEGDHEVDRPQQLRVDRLGRLVADVDAHLRQGLRRQGVDLGAGIGAGGVDLDVVAGDGAHEPGRHLGLAAVAHADEQHRRHQLALVGAVSPLASSSSPRSVRTRVSISSRIGRISSGLLPAGSVSSQSR